MDWVLVFSVSRGNPHTVGSNAPTQRETFLGSGLLESKIFWLLQKMLHTVYRVCDMWPVLCNTKPTVTSLAFLSD